MQAAIKEIGDVRTVKALGLGVGLGDADDLRKGGAVGRVVGAHLGDALPIALHQPPRPQVTEKAEVGVVVGILDAEIVGLDRAAAGDEYRRMRFLNRLWPAIGV